MYSFELFSFNIGQGLGAVHFTMLAPMYDVLVVDMNGV